MELVVDIFEARFWKDTFEHINRVLETVYATYINILFSGLSEPGNYYLESS